MLRVRRQIRQILSAEMPQKLPEENPSKRKQFLASHGENELAQNQKGKNKPQSYSSGCQVTLLVTS